MSEMRDRPHAARRAIELSVDYLGKGFFGQGTVINVFPYGFLVLGDCLPAVGTNVSLRIFQPDGQGIVPVEQAVVSWRRGSQLGMEILTMTPDAHMRLAEAMAAILQCRGCVCAPKLPWFCRCLQIWQRVPDERESPLAESGRPLKAAHGGGRAAGGVMLRGIPGGRS